MSELIIKNLHVSIEGKEILKGFNLKIKPGEVHAIMGPNGTGKSTLAYTIMGHPSYTVTSGEIFLDGNKIMILLRTKGQESVCFLHFNIRFQFRE